MKIESTLGPTTESFGTEYNSRTKHRRRSTVMIRRDEKTRLRCWGLDLSKWTSKARLQELTFQLNERKPVKKQRYVVKQGEVVTPVKLTAQKIKQIGWAKDRYSEFQLLLRAAGKAAFDV